MKPCNRYQDVAVRIIKNSVRVDKFEVDIKELSKVLKDAKSSVQERRYAQQRIELADEYRNVIKESWRQR